MTKVSVILPTYNSSARLQPTLDSITHQKGNLRDFQIELIIVDDCSTDATTDILRQNGLNFLTTHRHTGGPNAGRNIGLEIASGDVICLIDHDDVWAEDKIWSQLRAIQLCPIVTAGYSVSSPNKTRYTDNMQETFDIKCHPKNTTFLRKLARNKKGLQVYPGVIMFDAHLKHIRFEEHFGMVDFDWQLRLFEENTVAEISKPLLTRFIHGQNLSLTRQYRKNDYDYAMMCLKTYEARYPEAVESARKRVNGSMARYFYMTGEMEAARAYFRKSMWDMKTMLYYCTSFYGDHFVKRHFRVFG